MSEKPTSTPSARQALKKPEPLTQDQKRVQLAIRELQIQQRLAQVELEAAYHKHKAKEAEIVAQRLLDGLKKIRENKDKI